MESIFEMTYDYLLKVCYCSYEARSEFAHRAEDFYNGDMQSLYKKMTLFKPDDWELEEWSEKEVATYVKNVGLDVFITKAFEEVFLTERIAGRFGYLVVEDGIKEKCKKAIELGDIEIIYSNHSFMCFDQNSFNYEITKEGVKTELEKAGVWEYIRYQIWLENHLNIWR